MADSLEKETDPQPASQSTDVLSGRVESPRSLRRGIDIELEGDLVRPIEKSPAKVPPPDVGYAWIFLIAAFLAE